MKNRLLLPLLLVLLGTGCAQVRDPEFKRVGNFKMKSIDLSKTTIGFNVTYFNPNNFGVTVKEAQADVYLDSTYLGKFSQDSTVAVYKNADFTIPFSGAIPLKTALQLDLKNLSEKEVTLRADGSVRVGKAGIFVTRPVHYSARQRLNELRIRF